MKRLYHSLKWKKLFSAAAMSVTYIYFSVIKNANEEKILKGSFGIDQMEGRWFGTTVQILAGYMVAITLCYVLLNLVSNKKNLLTRWGDRSLPIFLFHVFFTLIIKELPILNEVNLKVLLPLLFIIAVLIAQLLSSDLFIKCTYYLWNPYEVIALVMEKIKSKFNHEQMD
jgi:fucose 4-O-acetylase-like acetyltransferase